MEGETNNSVTHYQGWLLELLISGKQEATNPTGPDNCYRNAGSGRRRWTVGLRNQNSNLFVTHYQNTGAGRRRMCYVFASLPVFRGGQELRIVTDCLCPDSFANFWPPLFPVLLGQGCDNKPNWLEISSFNETEITTDLYPWPSQRHSPRGHDGPFTPSCFKP